MRESRGLSLIEVMIAFSIISVVFLALAMSQITGFRTTRVSLEASAARDLASRQIEVIRGYGYPTYARQITATGVYAGCTTVSPNGSSADVDVAFPTCRGSDDTISNFPGYIVSWSIAPSDDVPARDPPALYDVDVTVTKGTLTYVLASYLSCADAGEFSTTGVSCPRESLLTP